MSATLETRPWHPVSKDANRADLEAMLVGKRKLLPMRVGSALWSIRFCMELRGFLPDFAINLRARSEEARLEVQIVPGSDWDTKLQELRAMEHLAKPLKTAVSGLLLRDVLNAFESNTGIRLDLSDSSGPSEGIPIAFKVLSEQGEMQASGVLYVPPVLAKVLLDASREWPSESLSPLIRALEVRFWIAEVPLLVADLEGLQPDDCIIIGHTSEWPLESIYGDCGDARSLNLRLAEGLSLPSPLASSRLMDQEPDTDFEPIAEATSDLVENRLDSLSLPARFVIQRKSLPLEEINELAEGSIVDLELPEDFLVDVEVDRQVIARGRLTTVGDAVCLQVVERLVR